MSGRMDIVDSVFVCFIIVPSTSFQEILVAEISVSLTGGADFEFIPGENESTIFRGIVIAHAKFVDNIIIVVTFLIVQVEFHRMVHP